MAGKVIFTVAERFWSRVVKTESCWNWQRLHETGYGKLRVAGKLLFAHRLSWEMFRGPIPLGMWIMHKCDNRACVNPDHLQVGTPLDNVRDMVAKGRQRWIPKPGSANGYAKLSEEKVIRIRAMRAAGMTQQSIADEMNISRGNISMITARKVWKHI